MRCPESDTPGTAGGLKIVNRSKRIDKPIATSKVAPLREGSTGQDVCPFGLILYIGADFGALRGIIKKKSRKSGLTPWLVPVGVCAVGVSVIAAA